MKHSNQHSFHMKQAGKYKPLAAALLLAGLAHAGAAQAVAIPNGTVLQFDPGVRVCITPTKTYPNCGAQGSTVGSGTYFSMDLNSSGTVDASEKTDFAPGLDGGVIMGVLQDTNGHLSHSGDRHTGVGGIDIEWNFFGNAGMVFTATPAITDLTGSGATRTLDFRGWRVTWNNIPSINMGGSPASFPADTGQATIVCSSINCAVGDTFTLDYAAHVPLGDPSGFGGVPYTVHMVGTIAANTPPTAFNTAASTSSAAATAWTPPAPSDPNGDSPITCLMVSQPPAGQGAATVALNCSTGTYDPQGFGGPSTSFTYQACDPFGCGAPATVNVSISATPPPVCNADSASTTASTPVTITVLGNDTDADGTIVASSVAISSAASNGTAVANANGTVTYTANSGFSGTDSFQYTADDNNAQACAAATVTVTVAPAANVIDLSSSSVDGCSLTGKPVNPLERGDWWLVAGFLAWLGALTRRKRHS